MSEHLGLVKVEKDGIIDYPLSPGQKLDGVWNITPNPTGPSVSAADNYLHYSVTNQPGTNQWLAVSINTPLPTNQGSLLVFRVRANTIQGEEVKFALPAGLTLRFLDGGREVNWQRWDGRSFQTLAPSSIRADGVRHEIAIAFSPGSVVLFEDGKFLFNWQTPVGSQINPIFSMQVLTRGSNLSFDVGNIYAVPPLFAPGVNTPWDYSFTQNVWPAQEAMTFRTTAGGSQVSFSDGYVRFAGRPVSTQDSWSFLDMSDSAPAVSLLMYRIRVNESGGYETKITLPGENILRLLNDGKESSWVSWDGDFHLLAPSSIVPGQANFSLVVMAMSADTITLLENGVFKFTRTYPTAVDSWNPSLMVQHFDRNTNVSVDIGGIRIMPSIKTQTLLALDLQDELLGYFPLKGNLVNAAGTSGDLVPVTVSGDRVPPDEISYVTGPYGLAANFSGQQTILQLPSLPTTTSPSYTLSLWVKVNSYPAEGELAGIAGSLLLDSAGRLQYGFLFNKDRVYQQQNYSSVASLTLGAWRHVVVTYSLEESRLGIYVEGSLDSVYYLGDTVASASAILPALFYVGGYSDGYNQPPVVLDGAVGDIFFLTQHVHQPSVAMLADIQSRTAEGGAETETVGVIQLLGVAFLILAFAVMRVGVEQALVQQTSDTPVPSLAPVVSSIRKIVGVPAVKGKRASRTQLGIPDSYPILLDIGGEGQLDVGGVRSGFSDAININAPEKTGDPRPPTVTVKGPLRDSPILNLVELQPWDTNPELPFEDNFADRIAMVASPLTDNNVKEIARVIRDGGTIDLWIPDKDKQAANDLALLVNSRVEEVAEVGPFKNNGAPGATWYVHRHIAAHKRRVIFYATDFSNLDPLIQSANKGWITHVLVGLFHLGYDDEIRKIGPYIHLNEKNPDNEEYEYLWETVGSLQTTFGIRVLASLGGGSVGDFRNLFKDESTYATFYALLKNTLQKYNLGGIDLDIEEDDPTVNTANVRRLVTDLRRDFQGRDGGFLITTAPVASAMTGGRSMSSYVDYRQLRDTFDFFILQFYNGFGDLKSQRNPQFNPNYRDVISKCGSSYARKIVAGVLTNPADGQAGYNDFPTLSRILSDLVQAYPNFGGVSGWTYQHALDGARKVDPAAWALRMWTLLVQPRKMDQAVVTVDTAPPKEAPAVTPV